MSILIKHIKFSSIRQQFDIVISRNTCKIEVHLDNRILSKLESNKGIRDHPGIIKTKHTAVPHSISAALQILGGDYPLKSLLRDSKRLKNYINSRQPPPDLIRGRQNSKERGHNGNPNLSQKVVEKGEVLEKVCEEKTQRPQHQQNYNWKPIIYDSYKALLYAIGRSSQEYAILIKTLSEIEKRDPLFKPKSYLDFGSGVGTGMWAASTLWKESIFEYLNVDSSKEMHNLSNLIICQGNDEKKATLQHVYYRQFLPRIATKYDLIVSSFSLFELPNSEKRKEVLLSLWQKCSGYLIIVEEGSLKGSEIVNEARELLLKQTEDAGGSVLAPCPHKNVCPKLTAFKKLPCNFEVSYTPIYLGKAFAGKKTARYSYIILKKGSLDDGSTEWPRIVRPTLVRSKHVICRLCTPSGDLQEIILTKSKHGSQAYRCAKISRWGDRLPIQVGEKLK